MSLHRQNIEGPNKNLSVQEFPLTPVKGYLPKMTTLIYKIDNNYRFIVVVSALMTFTQQNHMNNMHIFINV